VDWLTEQITNLIRLLLGSIGGGGGGETPQIRNPKTLGGRLPLVGDTGGYSGFVGTGGGYYGGSTTNNRSVHIGPVNNYYVSSVPNPLDTLKNLRKSSA
jgi:hypothetical protein